MDSKRGLRRSHLGLKPPKIAQSGILSPIKPGTKFDKPVASSPGQRRKIAKQRAQHTAQAGKQSVVLKLVLKFLGR